MASGLLVYGATGYVGSEMVRLAIAYGLQPIIAGRDAQKLEKLASELGVERRIFDLSAPHQMDEALKDAAVVLHCAGPYIFTSKPMLEACLRTGTHYLDLTGEIPVYEAIASRDAEAKARGIMLMPGVGFDVVPTDCLAVYLKNRLPSATRLTLAFQAEGPAGLPPGTQRTAIELIPFGNRVRRNGRLEFPERGTKTRLIDFGKGPIEAVRLTWGDVITAYFSTGIPNIENYAVFPKSTRLLLAAFAYLRPLFKFTPLRNLLKLGVKPGPTDSERKSTFTHIWGEVEDGQGRKFAARLHGPESGLIWTTRAALASVQKVLSNNLTPGFQTPGMAYGADFVLECEGVTREDCSR